ncbi:uncharacterized protein LOC135957884 [Calliphora vicina]|uniref:uncharacterized protein LOC135957884 n=1 Tax=Calliphora vicina TaxID=7373 RepID=UPI00325AE3C7
MTSMPERKQILELIEVYRTLPALWDVRSPDYTNRRIKDVQYNILLQKYRESQPNADKNDLRRRINLLRTCYRREYRRTLNRKNDPNGPYKPSLFYFNALDSFLNSVELTPVNENCSTCSVNVVNSVETVSSMRCLNVTEPAPKQPEPKQPEPPVPKKKKPNPTIEPVKQATSSLATAPDTSQQMANVWGQKLSKMERMQRIIAERVINEVMFNAELGLLNTNTGLTNIGTVYHIQSSPAFTEPKEEIVTIETNDIFGI